MVRSWNQLVASAAHPMVALSSPDHMSESDPMEGLRLVGEAIARSTRQFTDRGKWRLRMESEPAVVRRVGWGFITLYALALMGTSLLFLAPLLVTLALKINSLVGIEQAPSSLGLVTGIGSLLSIVANPFFGKMSDRTTSALGMRRPWMIIGLVGGSVGILIVGALAAAPSGLRVSARMAKPLPASARRVAPP